MSEQVRKPKRITQKRKEGEMIVFRLDKKLFDRVYKQCEDRGISRSQWYREATRRQLEETE